MIDKPEGSLVFDIIPKRHEDDVFNIAQPDKSIDIEYNSDEVSELPIVKIKKELQEESTYTPKLESPADITPTPVNWSFADFKPVSKASLISELESHINNYDLKVSDLKEYGAVSRQEQSTSKLFIPTASVVARIENPVQRSVIRHRMPIEFDRTRNDQLPTSTDIYIPQAEVASVELFEQDSQPSTPSDHINPSVAQFLYADKNSNETSAQVISAKISDEQPIIKDSRSDRGSSGLQKWLASIMMIVVVFLMVFWIGARQGLFIKKNIIQNGQNALNNFENAKVSLESFRFGDATDNFALAYSDLEKASYNFGPIGARLTGLVSKLPFLSSAYSANTIIDVGRSISKSGEYLSKAMATISTIEFGSYIDPTHVKKDSRSFGSVLREFKEILAYAQSNIKSSKSLVATIELASLDDDKKALIEKLQSKIPILGDYIDKAVEYADFLYGVIGEKGSRTYMLVFQNNTELRATGGFIGSYALITFTDGNISKIFVDDVYNPDGQLKEKIIPPKPMQHITPTAGMRDANWWPDFPKSAQKIMEYYKKDVNVEVDGVVSITPDVFMDLLRAVGPIEMKDYGRTIEANTFIAQIQDEIEYGDNRAQPKSILKDLQPILFAKLKSLPKEKWGDIFKNIISRIEDKHILAYFKNKKLEDFVLEHHLGGEIKSVADGQDYISVVLTNVKGSKADAVTNTNYSLDVYSQNNLHELKITRKHNGGNDKLGFYNRQSPAYVRAYLPKNSKLVSITGNDTPQYKPLLKYDGTFVPDNDVASIEASMTHPQQEVDVWYENNKLVIGFWLIVNPQSTKDVTLKYEVERNPVKIGGTSYKLLWQKQSGIKNSSIDVRYHLSSKDSFISADKDVRVADGMVVFSAPQNQDHELVLKLK